MRQRHGAVAVFIRYLGRFSDLRNDGLSGLVRRIAGLLLWWKFYDVFGYLGPILTHRGLLPYSTAYLSIERELRPWHGLSVQITRELPLG